MIELCNLQNGIKQWRQKNGMLSDCRWPDLCVAFLLLCFFCCSSDRFHSSSCYFHKCKVNDDVKMLFAVFTQEKKVGISLVLPNGTVHEIGVLKLTVTVTVRKGGGNGSRRNIWRWIGGGRSWSSLIVGRCWLKHYCRSLQLTLLTYND